jgi:hypothetical protein
MQRLQKAIAKLAKDIQTLDLSGKKITELESILPLFEPLKDLTEVI